MTREEAIMYLKRADVTVGREIKTKTAEAIEMAIKVLEQEPCEDAISRQAVFEQINCWIGNGEYRYTNATHYLTERVKHISSIKPQEPKIGHWIEHPHEAGENWEYSRYECSECSAWEDDDSDFCPNCGAKMVDLQESEG